MIKVCILSFLLFFMSFNNIALSFNDDLLP